VSGQRIEYPNHLPAVLPAKWRRDPYYRDLVVVHEPPVGVTVEIRGLCCTVEFTGERARAFPYTPEEAAAMVVERLLVDVQTDLRPLLLARLTAALRHVR
jgi:hypothetical protein